MKKKEKKLSVQPIFIYVVFNLILFFSTYFYIRSLVRFFDQRNILLINIAISLFFGLKLQTTLAKKLLFIAAATTSSMLVGFILIFSTTVLPGSREHNHVMYDICMPAMKKHYGLKENEGFPDTGQYDKDGQQKWWYQHSECEQNVWDGKGPVFSENPPGFVPVTK